MTNALIAGIVLLIVLIQIFYLESLKRFRKIMLPLFTLVLSAGIYYVMGDFLGLAKAPSQVSIQSKVDKLDDSDYNQLYIEAFLAFQQQDYETAAIFFGKLYALRPDDVSYYQAYANTLLLVDTQNPLIRVLVDKLKADPKRDIGIWLLFAHDEEVQGNRDKAREYYEKALELTEPAT
jgi:predicted Zn-dependent protease